MNKDLQDIPNRDDIPELDEKARRRIVDNAVSQYRIAGQRAAVSPHHHGWFATHRKRLAFACMAVLAVMLPLALHNGQVSEEVKSLKQEIALLREYQALFANELKAVVLSRQGGVELVLGTDRAAASNPAVLVEFSKDGKGTRLIGVSGQTLSFTLDGKTVSIELLLTTDGEVLLIGEDGVWRQGTGNGLLGHKVTAHLLGDEI